MKRCSPRLAQLCVLLLCSAMVGAQTTPPPSPTQRITPNWPGVDIATVAKSVGAATGIDFIIDQRVRANVDFVRTQPMSPQQLYNTFLSILQVNGFAAMRSGNVVKIVPETVVRTMPGNDMPDNLNMGADEVVTTTLETKNINALQASQVLRQYVSPSGQLLHMPGTNTMYITDRASNVARIKRLLAGADQASNSSVDKIPLQNAVASEVARLITSLMTGQPADAAGGTAPKVLADDRTNSLLVSGDPAQRLRIAAMVEWLDAPVNNGGGTQIFALKYARAEELAATLKGQVTAATAGATRPPGAPAGAAPAAAAPSAAAVADRDVSILTDVPTNKLIITAPPRTMLSLAGIIDELDIAPPQVHIEAIIADVSDRTVAELGVNWAVYSNEANASVPASAFISPVAGTSIVDLVQTISDPASATNLPLGGTFAAGRLRDNGLNIAAMLRALRTDTKTNLVSLPSVTAKNNEESEMSSTREVPLLSGSYTNFGGGGGGGGVGNAFNTVNRQPVGTILKVTPQVIPGTDEVILKIDLESSGLANQTGDAGSLITTKRAVKTSVRVRSGGFIVIGGMMSDSKDSGKSEVPLLARIPLLGELFKTRSGTRDKSNLMIFIQPKILFDDAQANAETSARANTLRDMQRMLNEHKELLPLLPNDAPPELPMLAPPAPGAAPKP